MGKGEGIVKSIARFATRHIDGKKGETDLFLGVMFKCSTKALKPDHVYEIREILDELVIVDVGPCSDPKAWNYDVNVILECHTHEIFTTKKENENK
jgi:hypothetical protein